MPESGQGKVCALPSPSLPLLHGRPAGCGNAWLASPGVLGHRWLMPAMPLMKLTSERRQQGPGITWRKISLVLSRAGDFSCWEPPRNPVMQQPLSQPHGLRNHGTVTGGEGGRRLASALASTGTGTAGQGQQSLRAARRGRCQFGRLTMHLSASQDCPFAACDSLFCSSFVLRLRWGGGGTLSSRQGWSAVGWR